MGWWKGERKTESNDGVTVPKRSLGGPGKRSQSGPWKEPREVATKEDPGGPEGTLKGVVKEAQKGNNGEWGLVVKISKGAPN
jgi:hypothetical protein